MAAFTGYYDTGGAEHQGDVIAVAGAVATVEEWNTLDREWLGALAKYDLSTFHMTEVAHWAGDIANWPLKHGKRDEVRRIAFLTELTTIAAMWTCPALVDTCVRDYEGKPGCARSGRD